MKTNQEQIEAIGKIMKTSSYCILGKTFIHKDDLKKWGWRWSNANKHWFISKAQSNDPRLLIVEGLEGTWTKEI